MPEAAVFSLPKAGGRRKAGVPARASVSLEIDSATGPRLKYYSRSADEAYWTDFWRQRTAISYQRERRGHLPHQLRGVVRQWVKAGGRVLEAGCGLGQFTVAAAALGYQAEGVDWSAETIERVRQQFPALPWHVGDVRRLNFPDESFDAVYSPGVCEHFEEGPLGVLFETRRLLRPGGIAIISTPCFNAWLQGRVPRVAPGSPLNGAAFYQYAFTPDGLKALLERIGFEVLVVRPYGVLDTFVRHLEWPVPERLKNTLAFALDYVPHIREWGSACIWVGRKRERFAGGR